MESDLHFRARRNQPMPEGVAIAKDGNPTRDPRQARWLLTLAGDKCIALALAMKSTGVLGGSATDDRKTFGCLFINFKPGLLMPLDPYRQDTSAMLKQVKAVKKQPGVIDIRLPTENSFALRARLRLEGMEIDRKIYETLKAVPKGRLPELV